ncbi:hypothetical protein HDU88_002192 [Geranomyces variabilis]|nr:hypothetical protein HDU88_002192 [Geranomyces variabilis]
MGRRNKGGEALALARANRLTANCARQLAPESAAEPELQLAGTARSRDELSSDDDGSTMPATSRPARPPVLLAGKNEAKSVDATVIPESADVESPTSGDSATIGKLTRILVQYPQLLPAVSGVVEAGVSDRHVKILELEAILQKTPEVLEDPEVSGVFNSLCRSSKPLTEVDDKHSAALTTKAATPVCNQPPSAIRHSPQVHRAGADRGKVRTPAEAVHVPADDSKILKESTKRKLIELEENEKTITASTASTIRPLSSVVSQAKRAKPSAEKLSPRKKVSTTNVRNDKTTSKPLEPPANQSSPRAKITSPEAVPEEVTFPSPALAFEAQVAAMCVTRAGIEALIERMSGRRRGSSVTSQPARKRAAARASLDSLSIIALLDDSCSGHPVSLQTERFGAEFGVFLKAQVPAWNARHFLEVKERKAGEFLSQWSAYIERKRAS